MPTREDIESWRGRKLVDGNGDKIGSIDDIYLDRQSGEPEWLAVKTGLFGRKVSFVPIRDAEVSGDDVRVGHDKDEVADAPNIDPDGELSPEEERRLYQYYGRSDYDAWTDTSEDRTEATLGPEPRDRVGRDDRAGGSSETADDRTRAARDAGARDRPGGDDVQAREPGERGDMRGDDEAVGRDVSSPTADEAMTRSEEELNVGTERRQTGRARLRKHVVTENVQESVPVRREEARVEREPITDENVEEAMSGPEITEAEHEVTLHSEEPVVEKRAVPKERIRLDKDVHTEEETVGDEVRKERIESEGDAEGRV